MGKVFLAVALLATIVQAQTKETNTMREVEGAIDSRTFAVFDIDNTLISPSQTLGSDQWFEAQVKLQGFDKTLSKWLEVQKVTKVKPIEEATPSMIQRLQEQGITIMALTARPTEIANATRAQLKSVGIDLSRTAPLASSLEIEGKDEVARYEGGILFAGKNQKGAILIKFLTTTGIHPERVVFTDDKAKHTGTVDAALNAIGIPNLEFRYGAADETVKSYDADVASIQLQYFGGILPDEAAQTLLK